MAGGPWVCGGSCARLRAAAALHHAWSLCKAVCARPAPHPQVSAVYLAELAPAQLRGKFVGTSIFFGGFGVLVRPGDDCNARRIVVGGGMGSRRPRMQLPCPRAPPMPDARLPSRMQPPRARAVRPAGQLGHSRSPTKPAPTCDPSPSPPPEHGARSRAQPADRAALRRACARIGTPCPQGPPFSPLAAPGQPPRISRPQCAQLVNWAVRDREDGWRLSLGMICVPSGALLLGSLLM